MELLFNRSFTVSTDLLVINSKTMEAVLYYLPGLHEKLDVYRDIGQKVLSNHNGMSSTG